MAAIPRLRRCFLAGLLLAALVVGARPLSAEADACALVKAADVAVLLGGTPNATPPGQFWTGAPGTAKDRDALRVVARKAVAAF